MSFLVALWLIALLVLLGLAVYAHIRTRGPATLSSTSAPDIGRMMAGELLEMGGMVWNKTVLLRPHGERVIAESILLLKRGHNTLVEKAFGRVVAEKGKASSFFLKRIAEIKSTTPARENSEKQQ